MGLITFAAETLFGIVIDEYVKNQKEKNEIKRIIQGITDFDRNFDDSSIDIGTFQDFIQDPETVRRIFFYFFDINYQNISRDQLINDLTIQAVKKIKIENEKYRRPLFRNPEVVKEYLEALFEKIDNEREARFSLEALALSTKLVQIFSERFDKLEQQMNGQEFTITDEFIRNNLDTAINTLGERYSKDLNIITENSLPFESLFITENYKVILKEKYQLLKSKCLESCTGISNKEINDIITEFKQNIDSNLNELNILFGELAKKEEINKLITNIENSIPPFQYREEWSQDDSDKYNRYFHRIHSAINEIKAFINNSAYELVHSPYLLVKGEAGIGKSHLLADMASKKVSENYDVLLLLGQHFYNSINPWAQIIEGLSIDISLEKFLAALEKRANEKQKRVCIIIDALNEGEGKKLWHNHIQRFFDKLKEYPNIAFVFSVRTNYLLEILPENFIELNNITEKEHFGFMEQEEQAVKEFCKFYNLEEPLFPMMSAEYNNPLFLKMTCQLLNKENTKEFSVYGKSIGAIFSSFIHNINAELSKNNRANYDGEINVVQQVLEGILMVIHESEFSEISYTEAYQVATEIASRNFVGSPQLFLQELIKEGLFIKTKRYSGEQVIEFSYEKLFDYYLAEFLYQRFFVNLDTKDDIASHEELNKYFADENRLSYHSGVCNALSILLPEKKGIELFEYLEKYKEDYVITSAFLESLVWRIPASITDNTINYIKNVITKYQTTIQEFYKKQLQLSCYPDHPINSKWLYEFLVELDLNKRDIIWTAMVFSEYDESLSKYIKWVQEKGHELPEEISMLVVLQLSWFLTLNSRYVRDRATKAIINLLIKYPNNLMCFYNHMMVVDDPYVLERVYAILFGVVVKIRIDDSLEELATKIYNTIFNVENVYPHILLREYARLTVEYIALKLNNVAQNIDNLKISPPYNSEWYEYVVSNEDIDALSDYYEQKGRNADRAFHAIKSSMTTENGRGTGMYGDFGRYIFGSAVRKWNNQFKDQDLSNILIKRILELGYNPETHGEYEPRGYYDRHENKIERIGKKYQWIAFHELLAKLIDNFPTYKEKKVYDEEYKSYLESLAFNRMKFILEEIDEISDTSYPDVLDESEHILSIQRVYHENYSSSWDGFIRDIDPTLSCINLQEQNNTFFEFAYPAMPSIEWAQDNTLFDDTSDFLEVVFEEEEYFCLYSNVKKAEIGKEYKEQTSFTLLAGAFFSPSKKREELLRNRKDFNGNGVPNPEINGIFLHELYWSKSFEEWKTSYGLDNESGKIIASYNYLWEATHDYSCENEVSSLKIPCDDLVKYYNLASIEDGIWKNGEGEIISFDASIIGYDNCLLFRKKEVMEYMEKYNLNLYWGVYAEKISHRCWNEKWYIIDYEEGNYERYNSKEENGFYEK
ncbi:NACHT domain-containing protein [Listeria costaricensis]|uniref:NACHT domain-containing protein n=1 Tax=Listeria costaricensis TaxID=2026604 RepID=UPI000C06F975|nr:ATP-binding protein [Listeria costaricensis]